jgi:ABC-2 type transport system ATP-binding protein
MKYYITIEDVERRFEMNTMIELTNINKSFKDKKVLKNVSIKIEKGKIYGLIGENGAGKSTLLKNIVGMVKQDSGTITVNGQKLNENSSEYLRDFGILIEEPTFYTTLTVRENLDLYCRYMGYYDFNEIDNILNEMGLENHKDIKAKKLSLGLRQRLGIARAVVTKPEVLILDEPINSLDPSKIRDIRDMLLKLNREYGTTIIIASHILKELEMLVDNVVFISEGKVIEELEFKELQNKCGEYFEIVVDNASKALVILEKELGIKKYKLISEGTIRIKNLSIKSSKIVKALMDKEVEVLELTTKNLSLEDYYLNIVEGGR